MSMEPVDSDAKCIKRHDPSPDKPQMEPISASLCHCNQAADKAYPGVCNVLCKDGVLSTDCVCKDPGRAGILCDQATCKLKEKIYCKPLFMSQSRECVLQVNHERMADIPNCECKHGALQGDQCECDEGYIGILCEEGSDPWAPTNGTTDPSTFKMGRGHSSSKGSNSTLTLVVPLVVGLIAMIFFIVILIIRCRRRRSYAGGITIQTTAPGGQIATTTIPLVAEQPFGGGGPYGQYYEPPVLVPGQPVTTYHQPPAVATTYHQPPAVATTYGFQQPGMAGMPVPSAPPAPSQMQPVAGYHASPPYPVQYDAPPPNYNDAAIAKT